jgi:tetratricopeptide (TPR) repeat protein
MSRQQTDFVEETESFEAFDLVTEALEHIDSYNPSEKNVGVLREAEKRLTEALADDKDPHYLKARYFRAMVSYLENEPGKAIEQFEQMGEVPSDSAFGKELGYNIAAAYSAARKWEAAIKKFDEVIKKTEGDFEKNRKDDPELRLLARAGMALSYAGRIGEVKSRLKDLKGEKGEEAAASRTRNEERVKEYSVKIEEHYRLGRLDAGKGVDREIVKEAEQIIREAYTKVEGRTSDEIIELLPAEAPKKRREISARRVIIVVGIGILLILVFIVLVELFVGWDHVLTLSPAR